MNVQTKESQKKMTPENALQLLKQGNQRFLNNQSSDRNLLQQVKATTNGQYPFATVLSCIDSRAPAEHLFDLGVGDIFNIRIAGNCINEDIVGSMEFACKLAGSKLILVLGHTSCGAIKGACDHVRLGSLTALINKLEPAVDAVAEPSGENERNSKNLNFVNRVSEKNVHMVIEQIRSASPLLAELEQNGDITIRGGMYNVATGEVNFYDYEL